MNNLHENSVEDKRYPRKNKPKYVYIKKKLNSVIKKVELRKNKLSELRLEVAFLEKKIEMYKLKLGIKD